MEDLIAPVLLSLVIGGVAGYFVGTLLKRAAGMTMAIAVFGGILLVLALAGELKINIDAIWSNITNILGVLAPLGVVALISSIPFVASFVAGLFVGYRRY
jgi:uncharacterized membrane protein (Fun14 family)